MNIRINTVGNNIVITLNGEVHTFPKTIRNSKISRLLNQIK